MSKEYDYFKKMLLAMGLVLELDRWGEKGWMRWSLVGTKSIVIYRDSDDLNYKNISHFFFELGQQMKINQFNQILESYE